MFIAALFIIAKVWKQAKSLSTNESLEKMYNTHTHTHTHTHPTHPDTHRNIIQLQKRMKLCHLEQHGWA